MTAHRWLVVTPDGQLIRHTGVLNYQIIKEGLDGAWLEAAPAGPEATMYVDEEGKLKGLPINRLATSLASLFSGDVIVGPAVITGPPDSHGDETDVRETIESFLRSNARRIVCDEEGHEADEAMAEPVMGILTTECRRCHATLIVAEPDEDGQTFWEEP